MGHKRRRPHSRAGKRPPSAAALQRQAAAARRAQVEAEKAREAQHLAAIFNEILQLHRQEFAPVERPIAPPPSPPNEQEVRSRHEKAALHGIGLFQRSERAAAKQRAAISAQAELATLWQQAQAEAANWQGYLDAQWSGLVANDPETVLATLVEAFEDNEAPAAPIGVDGAELSLVVLVPPESAVPERMPATMAGTASELIMNVKRGQILPVDLTREPEIAAVLASIDTAELVAEETPRDRSE
jgi:hypothetical protein